MLPFTVLVFLCCFCSIYASPAAEQVSLSLETPVHTTDKWDYEDCGTPEHIIQIDKITVNPDPPQPGKNLTVTVTAKAITQVDEGAYADVTVKLGLIKLLQKRFDLCEEARSANTTVQCPVEPGQYTVQQTVALPREIPRAKFNVDVKGYTADDEDLVCVKLKVDFMKNPFPHLAW